MTKYIYFTLSFLTCLVVLAPSSNAQYYYKDILNTRQINNEFAILKEAKIKFIKINSFEDNDQPSEGFFCEKKINKDFSESEMISRSFITGESLLKTDYDKTGRVIRSTSITPTTTNSTEYEYDSENYLVKVSTSTFDDRDSNRITETHQYEYKAGLPDKMVVKKNNILLFTIDFIRDEKGNVIEENANGVSAGKKFYYYYDEQNRLTDVVRYNRAAKRLLPDYMFEYGNGPLPKLMTSIEEGGRNYFIWRYSYTANQLPEIEKCYSREKRLLGTIQYEYN